jgi:hypothetical protein
LTCSLPPTSLHHAVKAHNLHIGMHEHMRVSDSNTELAACTHRTPLGAVAKMWCGSSILQDPNYPSGAGIPWRPASTYIAGGSVPVGLPASSSIAGAGKLAPIYQQHCISPKIDIVIPGRDVSGPGNWAGIVSHHRGGLPGARSSIGWFVHAVDRWVRLDK